MLMRLIRSTIVFLLLFVGLFSASGQTDSLVMINGNILVGEIKGMDQGILTLKTDYSDKDFKIDWDDVTWIKSTRSFIVNLPHGRKLYGSILPYSQQSLCNHCYRRDCTTYISI